MEMRYEMKLLEAKSVRTKCIPFLSMYSAGL
jgi:hypothetical protein